MGNERECEMGRRGFLKTAGSLAAVSLLGGAYSQAAAQTADSANHLANQASGPQLEGPLRRGARRCARPRPRAGSAGRRTRARVIHSSETTMGGAGRAL